MKWIGTEGGPLILIPLPLVARWEGTDPPNGGRVVHAEFRWSVPEGIATDYDRACDVRDNLGIIDVAGAHALVLGDEPNDTCFCSTSDGGVLVRWDFAPSLEAVETLLHRLPTEGFVSESLQFNVQQSPFVLFDSACSGSAIKESVIVALPPGIYEVATCRWQPDRETCLLLHRLMQAS